MKRLLAVGLVVTLGHASAAFAEESLLLSASRLAREVLPTQRTATAKSDPARALTVTSFAKAAGVRESATLAQQSGGSIASSGMKKRTKTMIIAGAAAGFVGIAYGIDHNVKDVTPSSLGQRHDEDVFKK